MWLPEDEALQYLLYQIDDISVSSSQHASYMAQVASSRVLHTQTWNPLIFAIFHGQQSIVKYIFRMAEEGYQSLHYLLSDPFKVMRENDDEDMMLDERTSLLPLVLCLMTNQSQMLSLIWN